MSNFPAYSFAKAIYSIMASTREIDAQNDLKRKLGISIEHDDFIVNCERVMELIKKAYEMGRDHAAPRFEIVKVPFYVNSRPAWAVHINGKLHSHFPSLESAEEWISGMKRIVGIA